MMTLSSIFVWMVPWIVETIARFWSQLSVGVSSGSLSANSFLNTTSGLFEDSMAGSDDNFGFDLGFLVNLVWTFVVFFLSIWIHYFIEPGTMPSHAVSFVSGRERKKKMFCRFLILF
jgi:hypothetical protein